MGREMAFDMIDMGLDHTPFAFQNNGLNFEISAIHYFILLLL